MSDQYKSVNVKNLQRSPDVEKQLRQIFSECGTIKGIAISDDRTNNNLAMATITFFDSVSARDALRLNNSPINFRSIEVELAPEFGGDFVNNVSEKLSELGENFKQTTYQAGEQLSHFGETVQQKASELGDNIKVTTNQAEEDLTQFGENIREGALATALNVKEGAYTLGENIKDSTYHTAEQLAQLGENIKGGLNEGFKNASEQATVLSENINFKANEITENVNEKLTEVGNNLRESAKNIDEGIKNLDMEYHVSERVIEIGHNIETTFAEIDNTFKLTENVNAVKESIKESLVQFDQTHHISETATEVAKEFESGVEAGQRQVSEFLQKHETAKAGADFISGIGSTVGEAVGEFIHSLTSTIEKPTLDPNTTTTWTETTPLMSTNIPNTDLSIPKEPMLSSNLPTENIVINVENPIKRSPANYDTLPSQTISPSNTNMQV